MRDTGVSHLHHDGDVVLGDDWVAPRETMAAELRDKRDRRGFFSLRGSPLTRKIIIFNLIALNVLVAGILYLSASRDSLVTQRAASLVSEADLLADVFEAGLPEGVRTLRPGATTAVAERPALRDLGVGRRGSGFVERGRGRAGRDTPAAYR